MWYTDYKDCSLRWDCYIPTDADEYDYSILFFLFHFPPENIAKIAKGKRW